MASKLLTIGIITYNRSNYLKECLDHVCHQLTKEVELVVRDNCSNNYDFNDFIKPYEKRFGVIAYRNDVNIGADANCARVFETCKTKWLLVLGDDDYFADNAIATILEYIKKYPDEVIIKLNSKFLGETIGISGFADAMKTKFQFGYTYFISECIHNMEKTHEMMYDHYKYLSLFTAQVLRVMCYLLKTKNEKCLFVEDMILKEHGMDTTWNRLDLVDRNLILMFLFRRHENIFRDNIFKEIVANSLVAVSDSNISINERFFYYKEFKNRYGIFNILRFTPKQFFHVVLRELVGSKVFSKILLSVRR